MRNGALKCFLCVLLLMPCAAVLSAPEGEEETAEKPAKPTLEELIDKALSAAAMTRADLSIKRDIGGEVDAFRLDVVNTCLEDALATKAESERLTDSLLKDGKPAETFDLFRAGGDDVLGKPDEVIGFISGDGPFPDAGTQRKIKKLGEIWRAVSGLWSLSSDYLLRIRKLIADKLSPEELTHLEGFLYSEFARESEKAVAYGKSIEAEETEYGLAFFVNLLSKIDTVAVYSLVNQAARAVSASALDYIKSLPVPESEDALPFIWDTEIGRLKVTGTGDDVHTDTAECALIIDLGGNDIYKGRPAGGINGTSIIFDVSGDDTYIADEEIALGAGFFGVGILVDFAGDDVYRGKEMSCGVGIAGFGLLRDLGGNDTYISEDTGQGAACFGVGMLIDEAGNDSYTAPIFGQAFSLVKGYALLLDGGGNDSYYLGGKYLDMLREPGEVYQSMGQGFAYGLRPLVSGGIAILYDVSGNDVYTGDYFCQGSSYWHALGILRDDAGNDVYKARRYSQGAGIHLSVGSMIDKAGNDTYVSWGVSQGCGHDYAVGYFIDEAGDDSYSTDWMCNAAGNDSGIGIHFDLAGNDRYTTRGNNQLGAGIWDGGRKGPSMGLFIDVLGKDYYSKSGRDRHLWFAGPCGVGIDGE